jgi:hypothetical protein
MGRLLQAARLVDSSLAANVKQADFLSYLVNLGGVYSKVATTTTPTTFLDFAWNNRPQEAAAQLKEWLQNSISVNNQIELAASLSRFGITSSNLDGPFNIISINDILETTKPSSSVLLSTGNNTVLVSSTLEVRRPLVLAEIDFLKQIFGDSVDYSQVEIWVGSPALTLSQGRAFVERNTIHLPANLSTGRPVLTGFSKWLSSEALPLFVHEMTHVWQFQNGGWTYAPSAFLAQQQAIILTGSDFIAYKWRLVRNQKWQYWNPEQQAAAIEEYYVLSQKIQSGVKLTSADKEDWSILSRKAGLVRLKVGAPDGRTVTQYIDSWAKYWTF